MSLRIRVSYETDQELMQVLDLLSPLGLKVKMPEPKGNYRRVYMNSPNPTPYYGRHEVIRKGSTPSD